MALNYQEEFANQIEQIEKLIETPNTIQSIAVGALESIDQSQLNHTEKTKLQNKIQLLKNISDASLKENYKVIYNQLCVLSVSIASALLRKYFINKANSDWKSLNVDKLDKLKISVKDIVDVELKFGDKVGPLIVEKDNSIKFEDLKSTKRTFSEYFSKDISLETDIQNALIFFQHCRNAIVHNGAKVDQYFLNSTGNDSNIKSYKLDDSILLDADDWTNAKHSFSKLVDEVCRQV